MNDLEKLDYLADVIDDAKRELEIFIESRWPVGSPITWMRGGHLQYGEVISLGLDRVKVRNEFSGRSYWIDIYWIKEALKVTLNTVRSAA